MTRIIHPWFPFRESKNGSFQHHSPPVSSTTSSRLKAQAWASGLHGGVATGGKRVDRDEAGPAARRTYKTHGLRNWRNGEEQASLWPTASRMVLRCDGVPFRRHPRIPLFHTPEYWTLGKYGESCKRKIGLGILTIKR